MQKSSVSAVPGGIWRSDIGASGGALGRLKADWEISVKRLVNQGRDVSPNVLAEECKTGKKKHR
ncbi:hypothetical protein GS610_10590 [Ruegeria sp. HKCCD6228]|uniref:hypothetical protein n=1 Tax=unclassified Ruegeria TaxID=2625375 RepID=UPI00148837AD|nr:MULTISPECIES: hypothetical protein [unclassified Ruegeria]NOD97657.1 hypothetical protein [Ruegeria sp. HKCCD6228]